MSADAEAFGALVRQRRKALGWTQESLADAALGNLDRKGMISQIENGRIPNITRDTVKKVAEALSIDVEEIPAALRWSEAVAAVKDTNTVVHEMQTTTDRIAVATERLVETLSTQALDYKIKEGMLIALARRYAEGSPSDFDAAYAGLEQALDVAVQDRKRGRLPSNTDDAVNAVITRVDALNDNGDIDTAAAVLAEEEARAQAGLLRLYDKGITQAVLTRDVDAAVNYEIKKLRLEVKNPSPEDSYKYLRGVFIDWYTRGDQKGLNFDFEVAIALVREIAQWFAGDQDKKGACLANLAIAYSALGQRESGTVRLDEAVTAYRSALQERTRDRVPLDWASTQMNLGVALWAVGQREGDSARLEEAAAACRNALQVYDRKRSPVEWAMTHMQLGNTLAELGLRETGTVRLEEAVAAYREALEEQTRDRCPLDWAKTQMNLGNVLRVLEEREHDEGRLKEAVTAHQNALIEFNRDRFPLWWARVQMNLGTTLYSIGEENRDPTWLEKAIIAFHNALTESERDTVPLEWARTQMNLGNALQTLGERETGTVRLEEAVAAYRNALEERTRDRVPFDWANTTGNEAIALVTLADRTSDSALAQRAVDQLIEAEAGMREGGRAILAKAFADKLPEAGATLARLVRATGQK